MVVIGSGEKSGDLKAEQDQADSPESTVREELWKEQGRHPLVWVSEIWDQS